MASGSGSAQTARQHASVDQRVRYLNVAGTGLKRSQPNQLAASKAGAIQSRQPFRTLPNHGDQHRHDTGQWNAIGIYRYVPLAAELAPVSRIRPPLFAPRGLATLALSMLTRLQSSTPAPRQRAPDDLRGLLSPVERKNGWRMILRQRLRLDVLVLVALLERRCPALSMAWAEQQGKRMVQGRFNRFRSGLHPRVCERVHCSNQGVAIWQRVVVCGAALTVCT